MHMRARACCPRKFTRSVRSTTDDFIHSNVTSENVCIYKKIITTRVDTKIHEHENTRGQLYLTGKISGQHLGLITKSVVGLAS